MFVGLRVISYLLANFVFTYTLLPKRPARIIVLQSLCSSSAHITSKQRMVWFAAGIHSVKRLRCVSLNYMGNAKTAAQRPVMFTNWCLLPSCDWQSELPDAHPCQETGIMTEGFYGFSSVALGKYRDINPLNAELNPLCHFLALLAHHILYVSRIRVKFGRGRFPPRSFRFI